MRVDAPLLSFGAAALIAGLVLWDRAPDMVIYNPTPSMPRGFYVRSDNAPAVGALVTVRAQAVAGPYARERGAGADYRLLKRVAAAAGDRVCATDTQISVNDTLVATRQRRDRAGTALPWWSGCRTLAEDDIFLLGESETSFDGRYFGAVSASAIEGVWRPLLITEHD